MSTSELICPSSAPTYYIVTLHVIAACTVPINVLCLYLVWFHSPKASKYRYCLAYVQIVTFIVEIYMSWVSPGYYLFPMLAGWNTSDITRKFISTHTSVVFYFFVMCLELPSILLCFIYRHESVMELGKPNHFLKNLSLVMLAGSHTFPFITALCLIKSDLTYQEKYDLLKKNYPSCVHVLGIEGFIIYDWENNLWTAAVGVSAVLSIVFYGGFAYGLAGHTIIVLQRMKKHMSKQTYIMQKTAIISLSMQVFVPTIFIITPIMSIVVVIVKNLNEYQELATDTMFLMTAHSAASSITMLATNKKFKRIIWEAIYNVIPSKIIARFIEAGESRITSVAPTSMNQRSLINS